MRDKKYDLTRIFHTHLLRRPGKQGGYFAQLTL